VAKSRRTRTAQDQDDLFSVGAEPQLQVALGRRAWPDPAAFPVNHAGGAVYDQVWKDLTTSGEQLVVAGFASITKIIELVAQAARADQDKHVRVLLGWEPFDTDRVAFGSPAQAFTADVHRYWTEERGVSLRLSGKIVLVLQALTSRCGFCLGCDLSNYMAHSIRII